MSPTPPPSPARAPRPGIAVEPPPAPPAPDETAPRFWTLDRVAAALSEGGTAAGHLPRGSRALTGITTDTRALRPGDLFVALTGESHDAHKFLSDAVAKGAAGVVVARVEAAGSLGVPVFQVRDTLVALGALARAWRRAWGRGGAGKPVVGVTGSNGKTSTKDLLRAALGARYDVHATESNLNNRVCVPLTLFALPWHAQLAVVEMGTSIPGEIAMLRDIAEPEIAVVTSVSAAHLERLGSEAGVLHEKAAVFDGAELAVTPASQPEIGDEARRRATRVLSAGLDAGDVRATRWGVEPDGLGWLELDGVTVMPPLRGAHNLRNAMLALAVARECGVAIGDAAAAIAAMPAPKMRLAWAPLGTKGATLINDAYNANPGSTRAALELLADSSGRQRVAVLGTMRELGARSGELHDEIAREAIESSIEVIAGIGEFADALGRRSPRDPRVVTAPDIDELWPRLQPRLATNALVLLKASRGVRLERLVPLLEEWGAR